MNRRGDHVYLVTGGGGFIGSHIVRALVRRGVRVRVLENGFSGSKRRTADVLSDIEWLDGDVRDVGLVERACRGVEVVLHQAAVASVPRSIAEPAMTHATNLTGTLNVLVGAQRAGARRVVLASSAAVYGDLPGSPKSESMPVRPLSPYATHKLAGEQYCRIWQDLYSLETVALRYFNVFGPAQDPESEYAAVIPKFISRALAGQPLTVYGDGEQSRDFIYVANVVEVNLRAAIWPQAAGRVLNVGTGVSTTLNRLVAELGCALGCELQSVYAAPRVGDIRESIADITLLRDVLDYKPAVSFAEGLERTVRAFTDE
jgi:UDP-glucose 4-epimerase